MMTCIFYTLVLSKILKVIFVNQIFAQKDLYFYEIT
jgi:hypothetical protein